MRLAILPERLERDIRRSAGGERRRLVEEMSLHELRKALC